jgi:hypothetical protein
VVRWASVLPRRAAVATSRTRAAPDSIRLMMSEMAAAPELESTPTTVVDTT